MKEKDPLDDLPIWQKILISVFALSFIGLLAYFLAKMLWEITIGH